MSNISVTIDTADLTASLAAQAKGLADSTGMHSAIRQESIEVVKNHLRENYLPRDGPRGDFWADVIASTQAASDDKSATVSLTELGVALRYSGGEVTPGKSISSFTGKPTRALAIPTAAVPVAGGRQIRPGRAGILAFIKSRTAGETVGFLVSGELRKITRGPNKGRERIVPKTGGQLLYTLRTITRHKPDPSILPPDESLVDAAKKAIFAHLDSFE
jgi:hypothetical protein